MEKKTKSIVIIAIIAAVIVTGGVVYGIIYMNRTPLKVFHAGSLTIPLEEVEANFEATHPFIDVQLEAAGSVQCITKITESGEIADVLASADYKLIPAMDSKYQDYYIKFAKNQMVLAYTEDSKHADEITTDNFYDILRESDTIWGFSNPNLDPCGYRSLMVLQLAELKYNDASILEDLVISKSDITVSQSGGVYTITTPEDLGVSYDNLKIRDKSVDLVTLVQEGGMDYAFEYLSVAKQHGLKYVELDVAVDLSDSDYDSTYGKAKVAKTTGTSTGSAINYGITIPKNANLPDVAAEFVEVVIGTVGQQIFTNNGQPPIIPCTTDNLAAVPENLKQYCVEA